MGELINMLQRRREPKTKFAYLTCEGKCRARRPDGTGGPAAKLHKFTFNKLIVDRKVEKIWQQMFNCQKCGAPRVWGTVQQKMKKRN